MDRPSGFSLVWGVLVGTDPTGSFWPEALVLVLLLSPWAAGAWLRIGGGCGWRRAVRLAIGVYMYSRLAADIQLWGPVVSVAITAVAAITLARNAGRGRPTEGLFVAVAAALLVTVMSRTMPGSGVTSVLACAVTAGFVFPWPRAQQPVSPNAWPWHRAGLLWMGFVLWLALDGLTLAVFAPLVLLGIVGWLVVGFELWRTRSAWRRRWARPALSVVAWGATAILGTVIVFEGYFRFVYDASDANLGLKTSKLWWDRHVQYNSWNYRDREFEPLDRFDDHLRIVLLGDSFGFGWGIADADELLGARLEAALAADPPDDRPVAVFNLSRGGLTTAVELRVFLHDGVRLEPQVVVLAYMINDINDATVFEHISHPKLAPYQPLMKASYGLEFAIWRIYQRWFMPGESPYPRELEYSRDKEMFAAHRVNIEALVAAVRDSGAELVVAVYPFLGIPSDAGIQREALDQVLAVFAENEVPAVDVGSVVDLADPRYLVNPFDPHPNGLVNEALGPVLAEMIREALASPDAAIGR